MPGHDRRRTRPPEHKSLAAKTYAPKGYSQNPLAAAKARAAAAAAAAPVKPAKAIAADSDLELDHEIVDETAAADGKKTAKAAKIKKVAGPQLDSTGQLYITLAQVLKKYSLATTGGAAKHAVRAGGITVNGTPEARPGRKLHAGDVVTVGDKSVTIDLQAS